MEYINPPLLKKGDTIGVISPSGGLAALVPHRLDNAIKFLEEQGYKIKNFLAQEKTMVGNQHLQKKELKI